MSSCVGETKQGKRIGIAGWDVALLNGVEQDVLPDEITSI